MANNVFHHNHLMQEECKEGCPAFGIWPRGEYNAGRIYSEPNPSSSYDPDWYPMAPLKNDEEAFLWVGYKNGTEGEVLTDPNAHWRIIDRNTKVTIYDFLKEIETRETPFLWGYTFLMPGNQMIVKFLTHLSPGKQDLEYIQPCLRDLEAKYHREIKDYDIVDTQTPVLESYTPEINKNKIVPGVDSHLQNEMYDNNSKEFRSIRQDTLPDGTYISTSYLANMAPNPDAPFETMVFEPTDNGVINYNKYAEIHYSATEREALNTHYALVDAYNKKLIEKTGSTETHEPFMFLDNKLYFGNQHHADILHRAMEEKGLTWDQLMEDPPLFGWYHKPSSSVRFTTDTDIGNNTSSEEEEKVKKILEWRFGKPVSDDPDSGFVFHPGWNSNHIPQTPDITWDQYMNANDPQLRLFSKTSEQLRLFENPPAFNSIEINPGESFHHEELEQPFMYHFPTKTLFYTTQDCHHCDISPLVNDYLLSHPEADKEFYKNFGYIQGPWISGDITSPEATDRNWIKFIHSDNGHYPQSMIRFLQDKFGPRDLVYNTGDDWGTLPEDKILKEATTAYTNSSRADRLLEWRWSYDPDDAKLDVWEVEDGYPGHHAMTGMDGANRCVQGRVYLLKNGKVDIFYWKNRPEDVPFPEKEIVQDIGWKEINKWVVDNNIKGLYDPAQA